MFWNKREINKRGFRFVHVGTWMCSIPKDVETLLWEDLYHELHLPIRATKFSAGYDFFAPFGFTLEPGEVIMIPTGIKAYMNDDNELKLYPRSSLGFKYQMTIVNTVPKIDADYVDNKKNEGHIFVKIVNRGNESMTISKGEAFCQGSFYEYLTTFDDDTDGVREGGIGSTTKK